MMVDRRTDQLRGYDVVTIFSIVLTVFLVLFFCKDEDFPVGNKNNIPVDDEITASVMNKISLADDDEIIKDRYDRFNLLKSKLFESSPPSSSQARTKCELRLEPKSTYEYDIAKGHSVALPTNGMDKNITINMLHKKHINNTSSATTTTTTNGASSANSKELCFVHVGKTAGSTVACHLEHLNSQLRACRGGDDSIHNDGTTMTTRSAATAVERVGPSSMISQITKGRFHVTQKGMLGSSCSVFPPHPHITPALNSTATTSRNIDNHDIKSIVSTEMNFPQPKNISYLITLRNPIHRLISWYYYEHIDHLPAHFNDTDDSNDDHSQQQLGCGRIMFYNCYSKLKYLAPLYSGNSFTVSNSSKTINNTLYVGVDHIPTNEECRTWAKNVISGNVGADLHNFYNYKYYENFIKKHHNHHHGSINYQGRRNKNVEKVEVFVLRTEYLWDDWSNIDKMIGGTGDIPVTATATATTTAAAKATVAGKRNIGKNYVGSNIYGKNIHDSDMNDVIHYLCDMLCEEIQTYKKFLRIGKNLNKTHQMQSLEELKNLCPKETSMQQRRCPIIT